MLTWFPSFSLWSLVTEQICANELFATHLRRFGKHDTPHIHVQYDIELLLEFNSPLLDSDLK